MDAQEKKAIRMDFYKKVNMSPSEIENWLKTEESKQVGWNSGDGESIGHKSGKRIVEIRRHKKEELSEEDYAHLKKVNGYVARHTAQRPSSEVKNSSWRYSLMNWGHDPCKTEGCP
ncbi:DUF3140 domain-containing protein [Cytophagaceae bacterium ABcell3]|nr:DUF3140 domain-containing protein [Cytophagaceae bacterium ABcell3]